MIIFGVFILLILVIALIALAIIFWYISIPIILVSVLLYKNQQIRSWNEQRKKKKQSTTHTKKPWDICKEFSITANEAETIFGRDWSSYTNTEQILEFCLEKCTNQKNLLDMPKYLIRKLSDILQVSFTASNYETQNPNGARTGNTIHDKEQRYNAAIQMCNQCYDNYASHNRDSGEQSSWEQTRSDSNYSRSDSGYSYSDYSNSYYNNQGRRGKNSRIKEERINDRLRKFRINQNEAEIIFGKRWRSILGKPEMQFFYEVWSIEIKITYDPYDRYRTKLGYLYKKVFEIIRIVDEENPDLASGKNESRRSYSSYGGSYSSYHNSDETFDDDYSQSNDYGYSESRHEEIRKVDWAFSVFDLKADSTYEDIKKRYRELSLKFHPDRNKTAESTKKMAEINSAYEILMEGRRASAS